MAEESDCVTVPVATVDTSGARSVGLAAPMIAHAQAANFALVEVSVIDVPPSAPVACFHAMTVMSSLASDVSSLTISTQPAGNVMAPATAFRKATIRRSLLAIVGGNRIDGEAVAV